jgi:signal transduction histidine kinase
MSGRFSGGRTPLFLRVFGLMLLSVLLVQLLNFAIVMSVPPPQPVVTTLGHVASLLREATSTDKRIHVRTGSTDEGPRPGRRAAVLRDSLARALMVPESAVRVRLGMPGFGGPPPMLGPDGTRRGPPPPQPPMLEPGGELVLVGDFAVSAKMDGTWRTVEPASLGLSPWRRNMLSWLAAAMIVVAPVAWFLARSLARPIGLFAEAARRLGDNPKAPPIQLAGPPEIREAATAFNEMQSRLNRYVEDRTTLLAAIAHDLRTPLMRLGLRLEIATPDVRRDCEADIRDMDHMITAVMSFVRDMTRPARRQRLDLRSLAESVANNFIDAGDSVVLRGGGPIIVEGDPASLKALITNLVSNAVKYAGDAHIALDADSGTAHVEVSDNGPGMAVEDIDHAFEPFFRAERSRSRNTGGIGLGLASVQAITRAHGGDVTLSNHPEGGLLVRVTLPIEAAHQAERKS